MDPSDTLIASILFGLGVMFLFGAYKNRRVLGKEGILSRALSRGSIVSSEDIPELVKTGARSTRETTTDSGETRAHADQPNWGRAVANITAAQPSLGAQISVRLLTVSESSTRAELMPLAQLLALADGHGLAASTAVIRAHVLDLTGESI